MAGGLTQTFSRKGFTWDVGIHYLGEMGPGGLARKNIYWLSDGAIKMAPIGGAYDIIHFPDNFEINFDSPAQLIEMNLKEKFPHSSEEIDAFFLLLRKMAREAAAPFKLRALPQPLKWIYSLWAGGIIRKWWGRTTDEVIGEIIHDQKLRSILTAWWGDHGGSPAEGSFGMHARIMNHFLNGAFYPEGGAGTFADTLIPVIQNAGGEVRVKSPVKEILVTNGRASGVRGEDGSEQHSRRVVSAIGARDTVQHLLPPQARNSAWAHEILTFKPSLCHLCLYLGFEGDIRAAGATAANHWIYESWDTNEAICNPSATDVPAMFITFPSLKDPRHQGGEKQKNIGEVITWVKWEAFSKWEESRHGDRPDGYRELKQIIEERMLARFKYYFPAISSLIVCHELSIPLSMVHFIGRQQGASFGLETTPRRFLSRSLSMKTPVKGLYLAGQDVVTPGITGAMRGGVLAAAAIDPRIFRKL